MFVILYLCQAQATFDWVDLNFTIVRVLCIRKLMLIAKLIATVVLLEWKMVNRIFSPYLKRTLSSQLEKMQHMFAKGRLGMLCICIYRPIDALCLRTKFWNSWLDYWQHKCSLASRLSDGTGVRKGRKGKCGYWLQPGLPGWPGSTLGLCVPVSGIHGKILVIEGYGCGIWGSCQELPLCLTEPVPACSKRDPPLAKAECISGGGSTFETADIRG